jgi:hypothetical protein
MISHSSRHATALSAASPQDRHDPSDSIGHSILDRD